MVDEEFLLELNNISKSFSGVQVLSNVNLSIKKGEVHALVGENGAGKSTLMKIILGIHHIDDGEIVYKNKPVNMDSPKKALQLGISMIHQELSLIPERTVAENIWIGREPTKRGNFMIDRKLLYRKTEDLLSELQLELDPQEKIKNLSIGSQQLVEIARAVSYKSDIIIMDEPTSALSDKEVDKLFKIIHELKKKGVSIIYISHKFDELFAIADRASVLRDGNSIGTIDMASANQLELIKMMVGRELKSIFPKTDSKVGDVIFEVKQLTKKTVYENISFSVKKGEILGIAGLMGAGRTEVMRGIFGLDLPDSGDILINNKVVKIKSPMDAIHNGLAMVTEDRKLEGLMLTGSVKKNISMVNLQNICKFSFINRRTENSISDEMINKLLIKTNDRDMLVNSLSGGNQQKVVIAKWLITQPKILILDEPTRGVDVGAKSEIYKLILSLAEQGLAIIMISSELPEILGMSDRVLVFHEGSIKGSLDRAEATQEKIMKMAVGN